MKTGARYYIECPSCRGYGCSECKDGRMELTGCPQDEVKGLRQFCQLSDLFAKGVMPISGGALEQSAQFVEASQFLQNTEDRIVRQWQANQSAS